MNFVNRHLRPSHRLEVKSRFQTEMRLGLKFQIQFHRILKKVFIMKISNLNKISLLRTQICTAERHYINLEHKIFRAQIIFAAAISDLKQGILNYIFLDVNLIIHEKFSVSISSVCVLVNVVILVVISTRHVVVHAVARNKTKRLTAPSNSIQFHCS